MARPAIGTLIPLFKKAPAEPYTRPADWLTLPTLTEGQQKVVGLHAVFPHDSNFCAFTVSGAYTVNWGDGTAPQNYASGATAYHIFNYANISSSTECTRGYRQAIVTITPQAGQTLTSIDFGVIHNQAGLSLGYSTGWLEVGAVGESVEYFNFGGYNWEWYEYIVYNNMLEAVWFVGGNNITNFNEMFDSCSSLQLIPQLDTSSGTNFSGMFDNCYSLQSIPQLDTSSGTNFSGMFDGCSSLQSIPQLDTSSGTDFSGMFDNCYSLQSIPQLDTSSGTDFSEMFNYCPSLSAGKLIGTKESIFYGYCRLSRQALIDIFNGLATVTGKTINITDNWGVQYLTAQNRLIATNKGWTIIG